MAVLSPDRIKQLWIDAGGNPQYADKAAALAMAASGGNPDYQKVNSDGTVDKGLWAINSTYGKQASTDPVENARAAVAVSSNGRDWEPWEWLRDKLGDTWAEITGATREGQPQSALADLLGIDNLPKFFWHALLVGGGAAWMVIGLLLLVFGSRRFGQATRFAVETVGGGLGFGVGARVSGGLEDALFGSRGGDAAPPAQPAPGAPSAPAPGPGPRPALPRGGGGSDAPTVPLPKVTLPSIREATGRSAQTRSYRVKLRQTVSSGGRTHGPTSGSGPYPRRTGRGFDPLGGDFPGGSKPGRHRAED